MIFYSQSHHAHVELDAYNFPTQLSTRHKILNVMNISGIIIILYSSAKYNVETIYKLTNNQQIMLQQLRVHTSWDTWHNLQSQPCAYGTRFRSSLHGSLHVPVHQQTQCWHDFNFRFYDQMTSSNMVGKISPNLTALRVRSSIRISSHRRTPQWLCYPLHFDSSTSLTSLEEMCILCFPFVGKIWKFVHTPSADVPTAVSCRYYRQDFRIHVLNICEEMSSTCTITIISR